jgi:hypothetical protein
LVVSRGDCSIDLEVSEDALDAIALAILPLVVANDRLAVRLGRDHGFDAAFLEIGPDGVGVVGLIGEQGLGFLLG